MIFIIRESKNNRPIIQCAPKSTLYNRNINNFP